MNTTMNTLAGRSKIDILRHIVAEKQTMKLKVAGRIQYVDLFTASMLVQIYDALNEANREKFVALEWPRMIDVGWKLAK